MHFFNNGPAFLKSILSKLKSLRCAKLSIGYGGLMFSRNFTGIKSGESFDKEWNLFSDISRQNEFVQKYCSADFQLVVRFETL